jgi:hypothetical protein
MGVVSGHIGVCLRTSGARPRRPLNGDVVCGWGGIVIAFPSGWRRARWRIVAHVSPRRRVPVGVVYAQGDLIEPPIKVVGAIRLRQTMILDHTTHTVDFVVRKLPGRCLRAPRRASIVVDDG